MLLVVILAGTIVLAEFESARRIEEFQQQFNDVGGQVLVVSGAGIGMTDCVALGARPGIKTAGGFRAMDSVSFTSQPGLGFQRIESSLGTVTIWSNRPEHFSAGLLVGSAAANEFGIGRGSYVDLSDIGVKEVAGVIDFSIRAPFASRWIVEIVPPIGLVDQCWVEFDNQISTQATPYLMVVLPSSDGETEVRPLVALDELSRDPAEEYRNRPQGRAALPLAAVLTTFLWLASWYRRSEFGLYKGFDMLPADAGRGQRHVVVFEVLGEEPGGSLVSVDGVRAEVSCYEMTAPTCGQSGEVVYNPVMAVFGHSSTFKDYPQYERYAA